MNEYQVGNFKEKRLTSNKAMYIKDPTDIADIIVEKIAPAKLSLNEL